MLWCICTYIELEVVGCFLTVISGWFNRSSPDSFWAIVKWELMSRSTCTDFQQTPSDASFAPKFVQIMGSTRSITRNLLSFQRLQLCCYHFIDVVQHESLLVACLVCDPVIAGVNLRRGLLGVWAHVHLSPRSRISYQHMVGSAMRWPRVLNLARE